MGLDMYAYTTKHEVNQPVDFKVKESTEIFRWRKHPNLHGWMEALYYRKGGKQEFNRVPVVLTEEDLNALEKTLRSNSLPHTEGFFFGATQGDELENDLRFVARARNYLKLGNTVFYDSWW